jgi:hypothetical protein
MLSCERNIELTIDLPEASAVLNASLSADSILEATVSQTLRGYYNNPEYTPAYFLDKASITVFANDIKQGVMEKGDKDGHYHLPGYYPSVGDKIRMEVQTSDFAPLSAEVTIPSQPEILSVDTQMYARSANYGGDYTIDVKLRFKEPANETNYYMLALSGYGIDKEDTLNKMTLPISVTHEEDLLFEKLDDNPYFGYYDPSDTYYAGYFYYNTYFFIFNDKAIQDDAYTLKFTLSEVPAANSLFTPVCRICLYSLSESYYLYYRSRILQSKQAEDPFGTLGLREPIPTYTNVRNGYGLLSAKQATVYEFKVAPADRPLTVY